MSCGARFGSPEEETGEVGQEDHGATRALRAPRGRHGGGKAGWRLAPVRGSGRAAPRPVQAFSATGQFPI